MLKMLQQQMGYKEEGEDNLPVLHTSAILNILLTRPQFVINIFLSF